MWIPGGRHCYTLLKIQYHHGAGVNSCWAPCSIGALVRGKVTLKASHGVTQRGTSRWDIGHPKYAMWSSLMWLDGLVQPSTWNINGLAIVCHSALGPWGPRFIDIQGIHDSCDVPVHRSWPITSFLHECSLASLGLNYAATNISHCLKTKNGKKLCCRVWLLSSFFRCGAKLMINVMYWLCIHDILVMYSSCTHCIHYVFIKYSLCLLTVYSYIYVVKYCRLGSPPRCHILA